MAWNGSDGNNKTTPNQITKKPTSGVKGLVGGILVAMLAILTYLFYPTNSKIDDADNEQQPTTNEIPVVENPPKPEVVQPTKPEKPSQETTSDNLPPQPKVVKRWGNSSNVPASDPGRIHYASTDGVKLIGADGEARSIRSTPIFKNQLDNMVWAAIRPSGRASGLFALRSRMLNTTGSDEAFLKELKNNKVTIDAGDSPEIVEAKMRTVDMKAQIIKALEAGNSFEDVCRELASMTWKERMTERIAQQELTNLMREGDPVAIRDYVNKVNESLRAKGLKELRMPSYAAPDAQSE